MRAPSGSALAFCRSRWSSGSGLGIGRSTTHRHSGSTVTRKCSPHAPNPLPHLQAPTRLHREAHAHEPRLPAPNAHGAPGTPQPGPRAGRCPAEPPRMVGKVLTGNGITRYERGTYDLVGGEELSDAERDQLLELCRQRLNAFRMQRGFGHRSRHRTPISGSIKYRVLTRAKGRCECCGAGCCSANPASTGPGGGPHHPQNPGWLGRPQQPAGHLLPLQRRQAMGGGLCVLRAGGQRPSAAGERTGAVHRRCRSGERGAQPGDPATAWG